jgi:hypothetical protein
MAQSGNCMVTDLTTEVRFPAKSNIFLPVHIQTGSAAHSTSCLVTTWDKVAESMPRLYLHFPTRHHGVVLTYGDNFPVINLYVCHTLFNDAVATVVLLKVQWHVIIITCYTTRPMHSEEGRIYVQPGLRTTVANIDITADSLTLFRTLYVPNFKRSTRESSALMPYLL